MNLENFRNYCLLLPNVTEDMPFDETTLVFRLSGKIFALTDMEQLPFRCNLKAKPERVLELCELYSEITPGYHMSKKHWITVTPGFDFDKKLMTDLIKDSYKLIYGSLSKKIKNEPENQINIEKL